MLRKLFTHLLAKDESQIRKASSRSMEFEAGAVAFIVTADEPARVMPDAQLYSELASLRLRTIPIAVSLAASRPVYMLPPALLADESVRTAMESIETLIVAKFSTGDLVQQPENFEALLGWLPEASKRIRLIADLSDNYAALGEATDEPFLRRYQETLGDYCTLTVPCEALKLALLPYAKRGVQVIEDPFESPNARPPRVCSGDPVRLCWFGSLGTPNLDMVADSLARAAEGLGGRPAELDFVAHETRRAMASEIAARLAKIHPSLAMNFVPWSLAATWRAMDRSDLVILPQDHKDPWGRVKSHNRLVETIRGGRLAVASPIPSYLELAEYAWVGEDLAQGVEWALTHSKEVIERIEAGQRYVGTRFAPESIIANWKRLIAKPAVALHDPKRSGPIAGTSRTRLNLGCGDKILPGYVNVDVAASRAGKSPDVLCDLHKLEPFASDSADEILAVHVVEHFWRWEVADVLREWVRVLKPGGRMILECPNLLTACEEMLKNPTTGAGPGTEGQRTMWVFYGDPGWKDPLMCHRWNYTPQSLGELMAEAGLVNIRQEPAQYKLREPRDMRIVGEKPM